MKRTNEGHRERGNRGNRVRGHYRDASPISEEGTVTLMDNSHYRQSFDLNNKNETIIRTQLFAGKLTNQN